MYINWSKILEKANLVKLRLHFDLMSALESLDENPKDVTEDELRYAIMRGKDRLAQASGQDKVYLTEIVSALEIEMGGRKDEVLEEIQFLEESLGDIARGIDGVTYVLSDAMLSHLGKGARRSYASRVKKIMATYNEVRGLSLLLDKLKDEVSK